jgi:hypothetical protein
MLPEEAQILTELRRRSTWEKYKDEFPRQAFESRLAKRVRTALDSLHGKGRAEDDGGDIIPLPLLRRLTHASSLDLEEPLPAQAAHKLLEGKLIRAGVQIHLERVSQIIDRDEELSAEDLSELHEWTSGVIGRNGEGRTHSDVLRVDDLVGRDWSGKGNIPTYLHRGLDEHLEGGTGEGEICCLMAPYGRGKSTLLRIQSYRAARAGKRVLYLSCEDYERQIARRFEQIHEVERGRKKTWPKTLFTVYHEFVSAEQVRHYAEHVGNLDLLFLDYFGNMAEAEVIDPVSAKRLVGQLRSIARANSLVLWTAVQSHDEKPWQRRSERTSLYGAKTVGHLCDLFVGVHVDLGRNRLILTNHKRRGAGRAEVDFEAYLNVDTAEMKEHDFDD